MAANPTSRCHGNTDHDGFYRDASPTGTPFSDSLAGEAARTSLDPLDGVAADDVAVPSLPEPATEAEGLVAEVGSEVVVVEEEEVATVGVVLVVLGISLWLAEVEAAQVTDVAAAGTADAELPPPPPPPAAAAEEEEEEEVDAGMPRR